MLHISQRSRWLYSSRVGSQSFRVGAGTRARAELVSSAQCLRRCGIGENRPDARSPFAVQWAGSIVLGRMPARMPSIDEAKGG